MRVKILSVDTTIKLVVFLAIMFVAAGDMLLPEPLKSASSNTKSAINSFLVGLVPSEGFDNPNERTEKAVEEFEQGAGAK